MPEKLKPRRISIPVAILVVSLGATLFLWWASRDHLVQHRRERFDARAGGIIRLIEKRLGVYYDALYGCRGLFDASREVGRQEWEAYVDGIRLQQRYPGIFKYDSSHGTVGQHVAGGTSFLETRGRNGAGMSRYGSPPLPAGRQVKRRRLACAWEWDASPGLRTLGEASPPRTAADLGGRSTSRLHFLTRVSIKTIDGRRSLVLRVARGANVQNAGCPALGTITRLSCASAGACRQAGRYDDRKWRVVSRVRA